MATLIIFSTTTTETSMRSYLRRFRGLFNKQVHRESWIDTISNTIEGVEKLQRFNIDLSSGAYIISSEPIQHIINDFNTAELNLISIIDGGKTNITYTSQRTPILRIHQFSQKFLKKFPDSALLGILILTSLELIQRQINNQPMSPLLKDAANITTTNLGTKLEILSSLSWDVDPFLKSELDALQLQPLEVVEKFILKDLLPRLDKDISPVLLRMVADPQKVSAITTFIKQFINETADEMSRSGDPILPVQTKEQVKETVLKISQNVDLVGSTFEQSKYMYNEKLYINWYIYLLYNNWYINCS